MDKYKKFYGLIAFVAATAILIFAAFKLITPKIEELNTLTTEVQSKTEELEKKNNELNIVKQKIKKIKDSITTSQKKIYSPIESDLGNDTLFFTLYNDMIEMVHSNTVKIKSINYKYNPETDAFVKFGRDVYFVCDVDMELVSNYVNLGKLIQDIYQYPYYIKINSLEVNPYQKDKTILLSKLRLRLYAHTEPSEDETAAQEAAAPALDGANTALPQ